MQQPSLGLAQAPAVATVTAGPALCCAALLRRRWRGRWGLVWAPPTPAPLGRWRAPGCSACGSSTAACPPCATPRWTYRRCCRWGGRLYGGGAYAGGRGEMPLGARGAGCSKGWLRWEEQRQRWPRFEAEIKWQRAGWCSIDSEQSAMKPQIGWLLARSTPRLRLPSRRTRCRQRRARRPSPPRRRPLH